MRETLSCQALWWIKLQNQVQRKKIVLTCILNAKALFHVHFSTNHFISWSSMYCSFPGKSNTTRWTQNFAFFCYLTLSVVFCYSISSVLLLKRLSKILKVIFEHTFLDRLWPACLFPLFCICTSLCDNFDSKYPQIGQAVSSWVEQNTWTAQLLSLHNASFVEAKTTFWCCCCLDYLFCFNSSYFCLSIKPEWYHFCMQKEALSMPCTGWAAMACMVFVVFYKLF